VGWTSLIAPGRELHVIEHDPEGGKPRGHILQLGAANQPRIGQRTRDPGVQTPSPGCAVDEGEEHRQEGEIIDLSFQRYLDRLIGQRPPDPGISWQTAAGPETPVESPSAPE
jgi:hypothetical protein